MSATKVPASEMAASEMYAAEVTKVTYAEVAPSKVTAEVAATMTATMAAAMSASSATASGECRARQRGQQNHNDNSTAFRDDHRYPLPVVAPPHLAQLQCDESVWLVSPRTCACCSICADTAFKPPA